MNIGLIILAVTVFLLLVWWIWHYMFKVPKQEIDFAKRFFAKNFKECETNKIKVIKKIHNGFTNLSFYVVLEDDSEYQLRFAMNNKIVDRKNEKNVISLLGDKDYIYFDEYGNYIKKWVKGKMITLQEIDDNFLDQLKDKINQFHKINFSNTDIVKHNYNMDNFKKLSKKYLEKYNEFLVNIDKKDWVLSHNDLNLRNILVGDKSNIIFIDFEWARINHPYWDIVNFCRETKFTNQQLCDVAKRFEISEEQFFMMYFICLCYAYKWTCENNFSFKILAYRINTVKQIIKTFKYLKKFNC